MRIELGVLDGLPWLIINSGKLSVNTTSSKYHGYMRINFLNPKWYLKDDIKGIDEFNEYDLFSTIEHEAFHILGFASGMADKGNSLLPSHNNGYFRFDNFLNLKYSNTPTPIKLIDYDKTNPYNWFFNSNQITNSQDLHKSCSDAIGQVSPDMVFSTSNNQDYPIFTADVYQGGTSFSHLSRECDGKKTSDFLMEASITTGTTNSSGVRKTATLEEWDIMNQIGYQVQGFSANVMAGADDDKVDCKEFFINSCDKKGLDIDLLALSI